ncbi:MAG: hypothetical protein ACTSQE_06740 [Candidatus Heimdallarchaeaceae archaeon]
MKTILIYTALVVAILLAVFIGVPRYERTECLKWQQDKEIIPDMYFTDWQEEQCLNYDIDLK